MYTYQHPNGFKKIKLFSVLGVALRLHYWPVGHEGEDSDVHDHRWSFISMPLWGTFIERRYEKVDGNEYRTYTWWPKAGETENYLETEGRSSVREISRHVRKPLRPYWCPQSAIHYLSPSGKSRAVSLVLTFPPKANSSNVWRHFQ